MNELKLYEEQIALSKNYFCSNIPVKGLTDVST